jgi:hypothetical protein
MSRIARGMGPKDFTTSLPPRLEVSTTSLFEKIWTDKGSGADLNGAFYRPVPESGYFILGDYAQGNYQESSGTVKVIRVADGADEDDELPALAAPTGYTRIYKDTGSGADKDGSFWAPTPPFGYVAVGHLVAKGHNEEPDVPTYRCIRYDLAKEVAIGGLIWSDEGSGADEDVSIYRIDSVGVFFAIASNGSAEGELVQVPTVMTNL